MNNTLDEVAEFSDSGQQKSDSRSRMAQGLLFVILTIAVLVAPFFLYPVFVMQLLCFALFALAFNLLIGFTGLLSFGHAAFFGGAAYFAGHMIKVWGFPPLLGLILAALGAGVLGLVIGSLALSSPRVCTCPGRPRSSLGC